MNAVAEFGWTIVRFLGYRARSTTVTTVTGDGSPQQQGRCPRVMVVDDHDLFRTGLRTLLQHEGYKTVDAPSGTAALATARSFRPEVVVMDMNMPGLSGIEAARMLLVEHPGLPRCWTRCEPARLRNAPSPRAPSCRDANARCWR
jgi:CheY-like chemotaxis protein